MWLEVGKGSDSGVLVTYITSVGPRRIGIMDRRLGVREGKEEANMDAPGEQMTCNEAERCLSCNRPACAVQCPVGVKIREVIGLLRQGDIPGAARKLREDNSLPGVTARLCPQEKLCEGGCILGRRGEPVAIGNIERFIADYERESGAPGLPEIAARTGKSVAILGSGPAGLAAAGDLIQLGHRVRVFEERNEIGGVLAYGIPETLLPREVLRSEVENLRRMGVEFETDSVLGKNAGVDELMGEMGYEAVYVADGGETACNGKRGVFTGGEIAVDADSVIVAMGLGRKAAQGIDEYLRTGLGTRD